MRTCKVCGCTDENCYQCIEKTGGPCHWVEDDLCSACCINPGSKRLYRRYDDDLQFEDPLWYSPGDWIDCEVCDGKGGWQQCLGGCDEEGKHQHNPQV